MHVLILDDDSYRHFYFARSYAGANVEHAYTYNKYKELLHSRVWDLVHLDHDLGDMVEEADYYVDGWGSRRLYTGLHAAAAIAEMGEELRPKRVIIQSVNPVGGRMMLELLQRVGVPVVWEPFGESSLLIDKED